MTYAHKCAELAVFALTEEGLDSVEQVAELAKSLESVIEDYIAMLDRRAHGTVSGDD